ncbi:copine-3-like [Oscarella lobularis]|uniref:copine-3-like n=1 Tax=Oscarella lobularis TaxID=121494 RepID=UPI0033139965
MYSASGSKVQISVRCTGLVNLDRFSKSDPMCVLFEDKKGAWIEQGRTEVIKDNLNPDFAHTFIVDYHFEESQPLKFAVYDVDSSTRNLAKHDYIGEVELCLADIVVAGRVLVKTLKRSGDKSARGKIHLSAEEGEENKCNIEFIIGGSHLDKKDFFGKSDPYLEISRGLEDNNFVLVHRTEVIRNTLNPRWKKFQISAQKLCNGDFDRPLQLTCWDWDKNDTPDLIGRGITSVRALLGDEKAGIPPIASLELIEPRKKAKKGKKYTNSGILQFLHCKIFPVPSFLDFVRGGCEISLMVAVDFTASNGDPSLPSSLHYNHPYQMNEYVEAIQSVGSVLAPYDSDQLFPIWGFGARIPPSHAVSHCFPLTGSVDRPEVRGVEGMVEAYRYSLANVQLYGPTIFSQILTAALHKVKRNPISQEQQLYHILLIITDGVINDMQNAIDRIVEASELPLSIVIVGVGAANFKLMNCLDADDEPLRSQMGKVMSRDIVQFVPLRDFRSQGGANFSLTREVLSEIPEQLTTLMKSKGIVPNPPRLVPQQSFYGSPAPQQQQQHPNAHPPYPTTSSSPPYPTGH